MRDIGYFNKIFLSLDPVDFRKQAYGLAAIVQESLGMSLFEGRFLFVFTNKSKRAIKILYWDETGMALWSKVLEKDRFPWPKKRSDCAHIGISGGDLKWLLQGVDFLRIKKHEKLNFWKTA